MASATKSTYSLDPTSIEKLNRLARRWQVSKTEVLRRALRDAAERDAVPSASERLAILHQLQRDLKTAGIDFGKWKKQIRDGRR